MSSRLSELIGRSTLIEWYIQNEFKDSQWMIQKQIVSQCIDKSYVDIIEDAVQFISRLNVSPNEQSIYYNTSLIRKQIDKNILYKEIVWFTNSLYRNAFSSTNTRN